MFGKRSLIWGITFSFFIGLTPLGCGTQDELENLSTIDQNEDSIDWQLGKADDLESAKRQYEVLFTNPPCDICTDADKAKLVSSSVITNRVVSLINSAKTSLDIAQFSFSVSAIEQALLAAQKRGVKIRLAINADQGEGDTVAKRLATSGLDVKFIAGRDLNYVEKNGDTMQGLLHNKFMIVDGSTLINGSNNWSSTGTTINDENSIVISSTASDSMIKAFVCDFEAVWSNNLVGSSACSTSEVFFTPSRAAVKMIKAGLQSATKSIDVLMHRLLMKELIKELIKAQQRGVKVRVVVNDQQKEEVSGQVYQELIAAGGEIKYKRTIGTLAQLMHDKLAIVDGKLLLNGSGNWSSSAFANNYENYVRYTDTRVVTPFNSLFSRLWNMSVTASQLNK